MLRKHYVSLYSSSKTGFMSVIRAVIEMSRIALVFYDFHSLCTCFHKK